MSKPSEYKLMKKKCEENNYELLIYKINEKKFYTEESILNQSSISTYDITFTEQKKKINLPNYDSIFKFNPKLMSMKYINKNYIKCIANYFGNNNYNELKIIGKIDYDKNFLNISLNENDIGLLISGKKNKNIEIKIIKEKESSKIYEKEDSLNEISEISDDKKIYKKLLNPHIILFKYNKKFLGKKRNSENLFQENIIGQKSQKKESQLNDLDKLKISLNENVINNNL